jgi:hypothetical protein
LTHYEQQRNGKTLKRSAFSNHIAESRLGSTAYLSNGQLCLQTLVSERESQYPDARHWDSIQNPPSKPDGVHSSEKVIRPFFRSTARDDLITCQVSRSHCIRNLLIAELLTATPCFSDHLLPVPRCHLFRYPDDDKVGPNIGRSVERSLRLLDKFRCQHDCAALLEQAKDRFGTHLSCSDLGLFRFRGFSKRTYLPKCGFLPAESLRQGSVAHARSCDWQDTFGAVNGREIRPVSAEVGDGTIKVESHSVSSPRGMLPPLLSIVVPPIWFDSAAHDAESPSTYIVGRLSTPLRNAPSSFPPRRACICSSCYPFLVQTCQNEGLERVPLY